MSNDPSRAALNLLEALVERLESLGALRSGDAVAIYDGALARLRERRDATEQPLFAKAASFAPRRSS